MKEKAMSERIKMLEDYIREGCERDEVDTRNIPCSECLNSHCPLSPSNKFNIDHKNWLENDPDWNKRLFGNDNAGF